MSLRQAKQLVPINVATIEEEPSNNIKNQWQCSALQEGDSDDDDDMPTCRIRARKMRNARQCHRQ